MPTADTAGTARHVVGWDVGGAHLKACVLTDGQVSDVAQWPCPLWQGEHHLADCLAEARLRWPAAMAGTHAVTMSGEMVDLFADREDGVARISAMLDQQLPGPVRLYAGPGHWVAPARARADWAAIASANWLATAQHAASLVGTGVLIDIGSTTTDFIALRDGRVPSRSRTDRDRLATGELVYHGVVRTPLCALARRITLQGQPLNVMNEFFATTADVYRLTGELDPAHDQHASADGADKSLPATRARLARMVGCDAREGSDADWLDFAGHWRAAQLDELAGQLRRVAADVTEAAEGATVTVVAAGCGAFLVPDLLRVSGLWSTERAACPVLDYGRDIAATRPGAHMGKMARWAQVCAPSVAVASLYHLTQQ